MSSPATKNVAAAALCVVAIGLYGRGLAYYWGAGPHDGQDIPSFAIFPAGSAALFAGLLIWRTAQRRRQGLALVWLSGVLLLITTPWWALNVMLERWAS